VDELAVAGISQSCLEAHRGVTSLAMGLGVERASDEQIARALDLIAKIIAPRMPPDEQQRLEMELNEIFVEASDNLVIKIARRGLSVNFMHRLLSAARARSRRSPMPTTRRTRRAGSFTGSVADASWPRAGSQVRERPRLRGVVGSAG
jgi:DNA-binding FadR family transcriptional regulator